MKEVSHMLFMFLGNLSFKLLLNLFAEMLLPLGDLKRAVVARFARFFGFLGKYGLRIDS